MKRPRRSEEAIEEGRSTQALIPSSSTATKILEIS